MQEQDLIYDWNEAGERWEKPSFRVQFDDETLRDGLQSPSVRSPGIDDKIRILHLMDKLGIDTADIGLPGAGPHVKHDVELLAREIFYTLMEAQVLVAWWRREYNQIRPHSALGYRPPAPETVEPGPTLRSA